MNHFCLPGDPTCWCQCLTIHTAPVYICHPTHPKGVTCHGVAQTHHEDTIARLSAQNEQALTQLTEQHQQLMTHQLEQYEQARLERLAQHQAECNSLKAQAQEGREQLVAQQAQHAAEVDCLTKQQQGCTADLRLQLQTASQVTQASVVSENQVAMWFHTRLFTHITSSALYRIKRCECAEATDLLQCKAVLCRVQHVLMHLHAITQQW